MLHIVQSNRLDSLADALLERWGAADAGTAVPRPDLVVVPSRAMERWLAWRIADRFGVCANVEFRFAAATVWRAFARALPGVSEQSPFDGDVTTLRLFSLLGRLPDHPDCAPLAAYLAGGDEARRLALARRIAGLFGQYMVYRPDWLEAWAQDRLVGLVPAATERWQRRLWRELLAGLGAVNVLHPRREFFATLAQRGPAGILPSRLRVFGLPDIPPLYAEILTGLARHIDVEWYHLNPCRLFWAHIRAEKTQARAAREHAPDAALVDVGNALLASWGRQRREQLRVLAGQIGEDTTTDHDAFVAPPATTLLGRVQAAMLDLEKELPAGAAVPAPGDRSLQIHDCHSLTRQVEVLHDQLLALFEALPGLQASDVAVITPDIDAAAPVIDAVFGAAPPARRIPYAITGRARPDGTPLLQAVDFLLALPDSRFEVAPVLSFAAIPAVRRRYGLDSAELDTVQHWLREAGARWGLDAGHRARLGLPAEPRHTWTEALYRLLVGYAMPTDAPGLVHGVLPYGELEGSQAITLGKLARLLGDLARAAQDLASAHPLAEWPAVIRQWVDTCLQATLDDLRDQERLRAALADLAANATEANADAAVGIDVARALLRARLVAAAPGAVPTGRVTFTGIGPLRGIPYRVVCLIGLEGEAFPRSPARLEFDLRDEQPRAGDRSPRDDDRGAFLDAFACARDVFYVSYTGRSIRNNAVIPPSVLVAELIDWLARFHPGARAGVEDAVVTRHPLQPFDSGYFGTRPDLFSYDADLLPAARALARPFAERLDLRPLFGGAPLPPPEDDARRIELAELIWFFRNPASKLLRRLNVRLLQADTEIGADEPFALGARDLGELKEQLLELRLAGRPLADCVQLAAAGPDVPHGAWGLGLLKTAAAEADAFAQRIERARGGPDLAPLPFEIEVGAFTLAGTLGGVNAAGLFGYGMRREGASELLPWWLRHLVLCALRPPGAALRTRVLLEDRQFCFETVADPLPVLATLLEHHARGMREHLHFYPRTGYAYVRARDADRAMDAARRAWEGNASQGQNGERENRWYRTALGGAPDLPPAPFRDVAEAILRPMAAALVEVRDQAAA